MKDPFKIDGVEGTNRFYNMLEGEWLNLASASDTIFAIDNTSPFPNGRATNEGDLSPSNVYFEHILTYSKVDDNNNHDRHLSTTTADMHSDSRTVILIISNFEDGFVDQSPHHPSVIPITTDSEGDSKGNPANYSPLPQPRRNQTRHRAPLTNLQEFVTYAVRHLISNYLTYQHFFNEHTAFFNCYL
uniref:Uncharacterized protein n=1 Tax=Populus alba TaxID=43335 RepID=A0A4U5QCS9_POPAL|nr:hypothetical protein D5086_0000106620 [Populus alba]